MTVARWRAEVEAAERAFARCMADRDLDGFASWVSEQAIFYTGPGEPLQGRAAVVEGWRPWFQGPEAPFSWAPDRIDVLPDGQLACSTGPVHDGQGKRVARFHSVWRQEAPGLWRVVFDRGEAVPA